MLPPHFNIPCKDLNRLPHLMAQKTITEYSHGAGLGILGDTVSLIQINQQQDTAFLFAGDQGMWE